LNRFGSTPPVLSARINVELWEGAERTKDALQELATKVAGGFQAALASIGG